MICPESSMDSPEVPWLPSLALASPWSRGFQTSAPQAGRISGGLRGGKMLRIDGFHGIYNPWRIHGVFIYGNI